MTGMIGKKGRFEGREDLEAFMTFPYFIAVFDETGRPYSKQILATAIRFDPLVDRIDHAEKITQTIPLANAENSARFTLTVGFQLNRRQLAYNQANSLNSARNRTVTADKTQQTSPKPVMAEPTPATSVENAVDAAAEKIAQTAESIEKSAVQTEPAAGKMQPILENNE